MTKEHSSIPFNMGMYYYIELHEMRTAKARAIIQGNLPVWKDCLFEIFISISFKLNKDEITDLEDKFKEADGILFLKGKMPERYQQIRVQQFKNKLFEIDKLLIHLMNKYKMIFPNIRMGVGVKGIEKQYKLNDGPKGQ